jgi:hypothetical protein
MRWFSMPRPGRARAAGALAIVEKPYNAAEILNLARRVAC